MMGGSESYGLPRAVRLGREHARHVRERRLRRRHRDRARRPARARCSPSRSTRRRRSRRRARRRSRRSPSSSASTRPRRRRRCRYTKDDGTRRARARARRRPPVRGGEAARRARGRTSGRRPTTRSVRRSAPAAGSLGPVGFKGEVVADEALARGTVRRRREPRRLASARRRGRPRLRAAFADIRSRRERTTACPNCGGALVVQTAIEVGHIFKLGTNYSEPLGATFLDEDGSEQPLVDGLLRHRARAA